MSRVLIVDDDGVACEMLGRFARLSGFEVLTASTSTEGLQLARTVQPDVIVLDDRFPEGPSGRDVLRTLRQERHAAPVILISGYGTAETAFDAARLGAIDYLTKPVFGDALVEALRSALQLPPAVAVAARGAERRGLGNSGRQRRNVSRPAADTADRRGGAGGPHRRGNRDREGAGCRGATRLRTAR